MELKSHIGTAADFENRQGFAQPTTTQRILALGAVCMIVLGCTSEQNAGKSSTTPDAQPSPEKTAIALPLRETATPAAAAHEDPATGELPPETPIPENGKAAQAVESGPPQTADLSAASLERAAGLLKESGANSEAFRQELQSIAKDLPVVNVGTDAAGVVWNRVVMHAAGRRLEAVRFTSPLQQPADLVWMFVTPGLIPTWNILPVEGSLPGLGGSHREQNLHLPGHELPKRNVAFLQSLRGGEIQPGRDYVLWFMVEKTKAVEYQMALRLAPAGTLKPRHTAKAMARDLGLDWPTEPTPATAHLLNGLEDSVAQVRFTPDSHEIVGAGSNGTICVWGIPEGNRTATFQAGADAIKLMELSQNGKTLAASPAVPADISLWDVLTQTHIGTLPGRDTRCGAIAFSPDGNHLAAWYGAGPNEDQANGEIIWWDVQSRQPAGTFPTQTLRGYDLKVTPDGTALFATGVRSIWENGVKLLAGSQLDAWNIAAGERTTLLEDRSYALRHILLSADGKRAVTATANGIVRLLEGQPLTVGASMQQDSPLNSLAWSPDETLLALGGYDGMLRVWDVVRRTWRSVRKADWRSISSVAFSPDGRWLASGGWDGTVRIWDVSRLGTTPEELLTQGIWDKPVITDSIGLRFVPIPAGKSLRGAPDEDDHPKSWPAPLERARERPQREITITKPFYLAAHEVTVDQFRKFVEATGYQTEAEASGKGGKCFDNRLRRFVQKPELTWRTPGFEQTGEHPVTHMTWNDAQAFCKWMSETEKATYRLPTEAEWEHACRAGSRASGWTCGNDGSGFAGSVNVADMLLRQHYPVQVGGNWSDGYAFTAPVGSYEPNAFGLYDMHGNVWEWCQDWFDAHYYAINLTTDPPGPRAGKMRVQRGGSFFNHMYDASYVFRGFDEPDSAVDNTGFRPVREMP